MNQINIGFALTGSYCTFAEVIPQVERLAEEGYNLFPIMSGNAYQTDTRFDKAKDFVHTLEEICGKPVASTLVEVEPIGPKKLLDLLVIAPCTGNTLAKLATGITDSSVTLAAKAHLRNGRPVLIAVSTNDALSNGAKNIGGLLNYKNIYFVPMAQDDSGNKPTSIVADFQKIPDSVNKALMNNQPQPILY